MPSPRSYLVSKIRGNKELLKYALKIYSIQHPPPYRQPRMEFDFDSWNGISSMHCWNGRQIGEDNSGPYPYREISGNQYETCPFTDSRQGLLMNVTNLRLVMPVAEQAYQLLTEFRNRYIEERHLPNSELTLVQAYLLAKLSVCLPAYLARRKYNPLRDGSLQAVETACYMVGGAPYLLVRQLMVRGNSTPLKPQPWSGRQLYELSDASGVLISIRRSACPAAARLIADLYDVIMNGTYKKPIDSPEVSRARHEIGDWRQFYNYTLAASRLELLLKLSQAITAKTLLLHREKNGLKQGSTSSGLERALQNALALSHAKISDEKDAHLILDNIINVLCALLKDHGESDTLIKLQCNDTSMPDAAFQIIFSDCGGELLRQRLQVLKEACSREMTAVHNTLQRPNWGSFTDRDFYKRTAGGEFQDLVYTL